MIKVSIPCSLDLNLILIHIDDPISHILDLLLLHLRCCLRARNGLSLQWWSASLKSWLLNCSNRANALLSVFVVRLLILRKGIFQWLVLRTLQWVYWLSRVKSPASCSCLAKLTLRAFKVSFLLYNKWWENEGCTYRWWLERILLLHERAGGNISC